MNDLGSAVRFVEAVLGEPLTPWQRRLLEGFRSRGPEGGETLLQFVQQHATATARAKRTRLRRIHTEYSRRRS